MEIILKKYVIVITLYSGTLILYVVIIIVCVYMRWNSENRGDLTSYTTRYILYVRRAIVKRAHKYNMYEKPMGRVAV